MTRFVLTFLALTGCQSRITGNEGNFLFSYWADDDIVDFNKPIAVNAFLDVEVREVGTQLPVTLTDASTDDPAVLDVTGFDSYVATVQGMGDGGALLSVAGTTAGGDALTDSVNLLARVPEVHVLGHTCTPDTTAGYLVDSEILVPYEFMMTNGQNVIGYGYYPVSTQAAQAIRDEVNRFGGPLSPARQKRLGDVLLTARRYEIRFWEMCWAGETWPGAR